MKFFTAFTILAITVAASISAAPSNDGTFSIVERDTPTCWLDDKIGGVSVLNRNDRIITMLTDFLLLTDM